MTWTIFDTIRGDKGDKGDPGTIASSSFEFVEPGDPRAGVYMSGTDAVMHAHFVLPSGLPGMNAVPTDAGVAAYVTSPGSAVHTALTGLFVVYRVMVAGVYQPRIPGALNIFIGATHPGLAMSGNDLWVNPDTTTLAAVTAAMMDRSSPLFAAAALATTTQQLVLFVGSADVVGSSYGIDPNNVYALDLPKDGTKSVRFSGRVPAGWTRVTVRGTWLHDAGAGAARLQFAYRTMAATAVDKSYSTTQNYVSSGTMRRNEVLLNDREVTPGTIISGTITRLSTSSDDTISGKVGVLSVEMERIA